MHLEYAGVFEQHRYSVSRVFWNLGFVTSSIEGLPPEAWDRYENPFEQKWTVRDKFNLPPSLESVIAHLEEQVEMASVLFGVQLEVDSSRHYAGIFRYEKGDQLGVHVDAGIHPDNGKRKHVTALLYLGFGANGDLEFWNGDYCCILDKYHPDGPSVYTLAKRIPPRHGTLVLFENNDMAWHGAAANSVSANRLVVTVSYLSNQVHAFRNLRERAYFVPRPDEKWGAETWVLRDKRADPEKFAEAYRV